MKVFYQVSNLVLLLSCFALSTCETSTTTDSSQPTGKVQPIIITEPVMFDTDDPAIWIDKVKPSNSLIIGTDKDENGGLYAFDLNGKILPDRTVFELKRPNNVDIAYGLVLSGLATDIAVVTERLTHNLRIFSLPNLKPIDGGGIPVFEGDTIAGYRDLMGIALYTSPDSKIYAIVGRKTGPTEEGYLAQYLLEDNGAGIVKATLIRKFGKYSGNKEIESIAVDNELGYIYYSDEGVGVRKYFANPAKGNNELALFATTGFTQDHEGISIYKINDGTGYILVSDQQANQFRVFSREGTTKNPHDHTLLKVINASTEESDGSDVTNVSLNDQFKSGLFVAMSTDKTFQFYRWEDIAGTDLKVAPNGVLKK
jgi:3-phytase